MTDYFHLDFEYNSLLKYQSENLTLIENLLKFYNYIYATSNSYLNDISKKKDEFIKNYSISNYEISNLIYKYLNSKSNLFSSYFKLFDHIKKDFIFPLEKLLNELKEFYKNSNNNLMKIKNNIKIKKEILEENLKNYYEQFEISQRNEESNFNLIQNNFNLDDFKKNYINQIEITNNYYDEFNKEYLKIFEENLINEEKKNKQLKTIFKNLFDIEKDLFLNEKISNENFISPFVLYIINKDFEKYKNSFYFFEEENKRILKEEFISYKNYLKLHSKKFTNKEKLEFNIAMNEESFANFIILNENKKILSDEEKISIFSKNILKKEEINSENFHNIIELIIKNKFNEFPLKFLKKFISLKKENFLFFENKKNLIYFSKIIDSIINTYFNINNIKNYVDEINNILILSEESFYLEENIFLCYFLSENNFFKLKEIWEKLIFFRIINKINFEINNIYQRDFSYIDTLNNYLFNFKEDENNKNLLIFQYKFENYLNKNYFYFNLKQKNEIEEKLNKIIRKIIKDFIKHLNCYNFSNTEIINIIIDFFMNKIKIPDNEINFYMKFIIFESFSVKKKENNFANNFLLLENKEKISDILRKNYDKIKMDFPININNIKNKFFILKSLLNYIDKKNFSSFFLLNKNFSNFVRKNFYVNFLLNDSKKISNENRIKIWNFILRTQTIIKKFEKVDLKKIKEEILKNKEKNKEIIENLKIIDLDVKRTHPNKNFISNDFKDAISNTLILITNLNYIEIENFDENDKIKINYFQGMNFLVSFLFMISKDEKKTFYLMFSLLKNTEFQTLFKDDLKTLNNCFKIFDKILYLKLPFLANYLNLHQIKVEYYLSPWLITLFTNVCHFHDEIPKILFKIWDEFLLNGFNSLFINFLVLLRLHAKEILKKEGEKLLSFFINDVNSSEMFNDENYDLWINERKKFNINDEEIKIIKDLILMENSN